MLLKNQLIFWQKRHIHTRKAAINVSLSRFVNFVAKEMHFVEKKLGKSRFFNFLPKKIELDVFVAGFFKTFNNKSEN